MAEVTKENIQQLEAKIEKNAKAVDDLTEVLMKKGLITGGRRKKYRRKTKKKERRVNPKEDAAERNANPSAVKYII